MTEVTLEVPANLNELVTAVAKLPAPTRLTITCYGATKGTWTLKNPAEFVGGMILMWDILDDRHPGIK